MDPCDVHVGGSWYIVLHLSTFVLGDCVLLPEN